MSPTISAARNVTHHPIAPVLAERWSPRGFDVTHHVETDDLHSIIEAARWAPSASNSQPWTFLAARRGTPVFDTIVSALSGFNQAWAPRASALLVLAAVPERAGRSRRYVEYDLGQAAAHATVQAAHLGLDVHQMGGFDPDALHAALDLPADVLPLTVVAIGRHDPSDAVARDIRLRDETPRTRLPLGEVVLGIY